MLTNQEIFDKALAHLRKQGTASAVEYGVCSYRDGRGKACAVGALIPDYAYLPVFDTGQLGSVISLIRGSATRPGASPEKPMSRALLAGGVDVMQEGVPTLLQALQVAHDMASGTPDFLTALEERMRRAATSNALAYTPPEESSNAVHA